MGKRSRRSTALLAIASIVIGVFSLQVGAAPASAVPQDLTLDLVEGELLIRDAEESYALGQPTSITGVHDTGDGGTGAVTGGTFTSPPISFETDADGQPVFVDAAFSQVNPGTGTGTIDPEGNVAFRTSLTVDLHIEVDDPPALVQECQATPVSIALDSTAPLDPDTGLVTVRDADFTVPPVPVTDTCISLVAERVNTLLAGSGHSLTMTLEGDVELPPPAGCPTTTSLVATPGSSFLGDSVTLDATVIPNPDDRPECDGTEGVVPAGSVEFLSDGQQIGVADLDETGAAQLVTDDLPSGAQVLTARARPLLPYSASTSDAVPHTVAVRPLLVVDGPPSIPIGGAPQEIAVDITNTGLGAEVINGRLDVTVRYDTGGGPAGLVVEWFDGTAWVASPTQGDGRGRWAAAMPATGERLAVGGETTRRVRLTAPASAAPGLATITFELIAVDPGTGQPTPQPTQAAAAVARAAVGAAFVTGSRFPTSVQLSVAPHTLRQGMTGEVSARPVRATGAPAPTGTLELLLDGAVVPIRPRRTNPALGTQPKQPVVTTNNGYVYELPPDATVGTRQLTVRYSGDVYYLPAQTTTTITVLPARGQTFACVNSSAAQTEGFNVNVAATALVPSAAHVGRPLDLDQLDIEVYIDRGPGQGGFSAFFPPTAPVVDPESGADGWTVVDLGFGALGSGTATAVSLANTTRMTDATRPVDPEPDTVMTFADETTSLAVAGAPGDVVPVALESIELGFSFFGGQFLFDIDCVAAAEPVSLGEVVVAGTTLTVDAPEPTREGDAVTMDVEVAPAGTLGTVELRDGATTLAVVPVGDDGTATYTTAALGVGTHELTARFRSGSSVTSSTSAPVALTVLDRYDCPTQVDGVGATVRLAYLVLADRCPEDAGYAYWVERLEDGDSPAVLARALARSVEGYGVVVDDAYQQVLARDADAGGRAFWVQRLRGAYRVDRMMAAMAGSAEFYAAGGATDEGFVALLYERILGRDAEAAGTEFWVGELAAGAPRWQVARAFTSVLESRRSLVAATYAVVLGRAPTVAERDDAANDFRSTGDLAALRARLASTTEFVDRAADLPNP